MSRKTIGRMVSILYRQSRIYLNTVLKPYGITSAEYPFLLYLYNKDGATQDDLACYLLIDKAATARAIRTLEVKQYVYRQKDEADKRYNRVFLTDKAREAEEEIKAHIYYWSDSLTEEMDAETEVFIYKNLEQMAGRAEKIVQASRQNNHDEQEL